MVFSDALIQYGQDHQVRTAQEVTVKDLKDPVTTSMKRYRGGIATYLEMLDNQRSLFSAQLALHAMLDCKLRERFER